MEGCIENLGYEKKWKGEEWPYETYSRKKDDDMGNQILFYNLFPMLTLLEQLLYQY